MIAFSAERVVVCIIDHSHRLSQIFVTVTKSFFLRVGSYVMSGQIRLGEIWLSTS